MMESPFPPTKTWNAEGGRDSGWIG